jgi:hypothetical protein
MKLLPILFVLLAATSVFAKDTKTATVHRHGDAVVFVLLPEFYSPARYMIVCSGSYAATRETGYDCKPAMPIHVPKELQTDSGLGYPAWNIPGGTVDAIRINIPESMY